ncbi:MBL fold metallo-hydrolase [Streptomyces sp. NPDC051909]|uniref:MBL fold metallo-hydrolase n=1 Tax=Streptomyces sp. NPDC051909 TaxID=3154944 RepID=UPI00343748A6
MSNPILPNSAPYHIGEDTWLIKNSISIGDGVFLSVNSMLIRGSEPVIVDTGAPVHREEWFRQVFSLVEPEDVRWIFLSHDDTDHMGNLTELLDLCPNATLLTDFFTTDRVSLVEPLPLQRLRWVEAGDSVDIGDRKLNLVLPPIFDGPTTRGIIDDKTGIFWAVDSFACLTPQDVHAIEDVPAEMRDETFRTLNSMVSPWHQWLNPETYSRHIDSIEKMQPQALASAHGPVFRGGDITDGFSRIRALAGADPSPKPGQSVLDELIEATIGKR